MSKNNPMFKINNAKKIELEDNETTSDKILDAKDVDNFIAKRNKAGSTPNLPHQSKKLKPILSWFVTILAMVIAGWILYTMGWS
ncbi:hypothetical protein ACU63U_12410 [Klebsiella aerogenes]|uniref:hypothetical protein n=1 Tax=Klebsiella TaxID=570 RepID=UPI000CDE557E|nr:MULTISPECIES: hypothetical protein [Klebsiella]EKZ5442622.1 hypothetical protein [Klebsiella aerogenes]MDQ9495644.1 hypothetical protein [Klebsiella aerogenes]POU51800.1 hypothetical protein C3384_25405 [Klebsiella aerogenes]QNC83319.1 hypothetical protein F3109_07285 [Klebsiella quasipneumoniae]HBV6657869.1 hypothetical protein [Klebsiella aerogenes]